MELDLEQYWTFGLALLIVLILIGILFWIIRRIGGGGGTGRRGSRLGIVEAAVVDRSRRLVLIRRDAIEHLVMIGGPQDVVVETNITKNEPSLSAAASNRGGPDLGMRPGAQAAVSADPIPSEPTLVRAAPAPQPVKATGPEPISPGPRGPEPRAPEPIAARAVEPAPSPAAVVPPAAPADEPAPAHEPEAAEAPSADTEAPRPADPADRPHEPEEAAEPRPDMIPRRSPEDAPRPTTPARPWPPSEGRFREAQRRFAERSDYNPPGRGGHDNPATAPGPHGPQQERQVANRAAPDGVPPPEQPREVSQEGPTREPANLNVRPGEDR